MGAPGCIRNARRVDRAISLRSCSNWERVSTTRPLWLRVELRFRKCGRCQGGFVICRRCDRGHRYCSGECSAAARQETNRAAQRRYRMSDEGREDHRDHERKRRARRRVGDHGIESLTPDGEVIRRHREVPDASNLDDSQTALVESRSLRLHIYSSVYVGNASAPNASMPLVCAGGRRWWSVGRCVVCSRTVSKEDVVREDAVRSRGPPHG